MGRRLRSGVVLQILRAARKVPWEAPPARWGQFCGGFGHRASAPARVAAMASGQRVVLPPGSTVSFAVASSQPLGGPAPVSSSATAQPTAPPAVGAVPPAATASAEQPSSSALASGGGGAPSASGYTDAPATRARGTRRDRRQYRVYKTDVGSDDIARYSAVLHRH